MSSTASIAKHPIHPMLIPLPIGLWVFALIMDIVHMSTGHPVWRLFAYFLILGGIATAILAAIPGLIDLIFWVKGKARKITIYHMILNLTAVVVFVVDAFSHRNAPAGSKVPLILTIVGNVLIFGGGWLGGEIAYRYGVGVDLLPEGQVQKDGKWLG